MYDYDASLLKSTDAKRLRSLQLFHDSIAVLSDDLSVAFSKTHKMRAGNGCEFLVVPRLAFVAADFQQIQQNTLLHGRGCHFCECPFESLDDTTQRWPLRNSRDTIKSMYILANKVLNADGSIKYGKKKVIEEWEKEHKTKILENGFAPLLKYGFDICLGSPRDILHHILLGLFGKHIIGSIIYLIIFDKAGLGNPLFSNCKPALMSPELAVGIWHRLFLRLANINEDEACFTISAKMSKHFMKVCCLPIFLSAISFIYFHVF